MITRLAARPERSAAIADGCGSDTPVTLGQTAPTVNSQPSRASSPTPITHLMAVEFDRPRTGARRPSSSFELLSRREHEVLGELVVGKNNAEIARDLFISRETVKKHVSSILGKTGTENRVQAAVEAVRSGLFCRSFSEPRSRSCWPTPDLPVPALPGSELEHGARSAPPGGAPGPQLVDHAQHAQLGVQKHDVDGEPHEPRMHRARRPQQQAVAGGQPALPEQPLEAGQWIVGDDTALADDGHSCPVQALDHGRGQLPSDWVSELIAG